MKTKTWLKIGLIFLTASFLSSCGKKVDELNLTANSTSVTGDLEGYLELVSNSITLAPSTKYGKGLEAKAKFKIIKPFTTMGVTKGIDHIGLTLLDEGGMPVSGLDALKFEGFCCYDDVQSLKGLLKNGNGEFIATFYMQTPYELIGEDFKKILAEKENNLKSFSISSSVVIDEFENNTSDAASESSNDGLSSNDETGSENWDKLLDDYEAYVDDYIRLYKKAMNGDQSALAEYPSLMEKATNLQESMTQAQSDNKLSGKQISRLTTIQTKMIQAAQ